MSVETYFRHKEIIGTNKRLTATENCVHSRDVTQIRREVPLTVYAMKQMISLDARCFEI